MRDMDPTILVKQTGEIVIGFTPILEESMDEISLKGTRNGEVVIIARKEWHPVVTGFELERLNSNKRQGARWTVKKVDKGLFWEAFDDQWQKAPFMDIAPGLIVRIFSTEYQGIRHSTQGATWWENRPGLGQETPSKLQLLKCPENRDQFRSLMKRLGGHLLTMCMLENFVEWTAMGFEAGHAPSLKVPYHKITNEDVLEIARYTKDSLGTMIPEWLADRAEEKQAVQAFVDGMEKRSFDPRRALSKLIRLCWEIQRKDAPIYLVNDGISEWFIKKVYQELEAAVASFP